MRERLTRYVVQPQPGPVLHCQLDLSQSCQILVCSDGWWETEGTSHLQLLKPTLVQGYGGQGVKGGAEGTGRIKLPAEKKPMQWLYPNCYDFNLVVFY